MRMRGTLNRIGFTRVWRISAGYAAALPVDLQFSGKFFAFPSFSHVFGDQIQNFYKARSSLGPEFGISQGENALWGPNSEFP